MEERFFFATLLLLLAGLPRLAGASSGELWTRLSTDQSLLEDGMVTTESHLASIREGYGDEVTLPFDSATSEPSPEGTSLLYEVIKTEPEGISKQEGQTLAALARQPESSEQPFPDGALLTHQNSTATTSQPLITAGVSRLSSSSFSPRPINLATFLTRKDGRGNTLEQTLGISGTPSNPKTDKPEETDLLPTAPFDSEPSDVTRLGLADTPTLAMSPARSLHVFPLGENRTGPEGHFAETVHTPTKGGIGTHVSDTSKTNQSSQVTNLQTQLDVRASDVAKTLGFQPESKNPSVKGTPVPFFQQPFSGNLPAATPSAKIMQRYLYLTLSPHGETTERETTELGRTAGKPSLLPLQSKTDLFTFLSTPVTLSPKSSETVPLYKDISQSFTSSLPFSLQSPHSGKTDTSGEAEEPLDEGMNSVLHLEPDHQVNSQALQSTAVQSTVRTPPLAVTKRQEAIDEDQPNAFLPVHSDTQPPGSFPSIYGQPQVSVGSTFLPAQPASSQISSPTTSKETSAQVELSSPITSSATRRTIQGTSEFHLSNTFSASHREQGSPDKIVSSLTESEPLTTSSDPILTMLQRPSVHAGPKTSEVLASSQNEPQHESQSPMVTTALALTKALMLENFVSLYPKESTLTEIHPAHSKPKQLELSTLVHGGQQERDIGTIVPPLVNQQKITHSASSHTSVPPQVGVDVPSVSSVSDPDIFFLEHTKTKLPPNISAFVPDEAQSVPVQVYTTLERPSSSHPIQGERPESILGIAVPSEVEPHVSDSSASFARQPFHFFTSGHAGTKTQETTPEGRLPGLVGAKATRADILVSTPTEVPPQVDQQLSDASVNLEVQSLPSVETQSATSSSAPFKHHSFDVSFHLPLKPPSTSASVLTTSKSLETSTSTDAGIQTFSVATPLPPTLPPPTAPAVHVASHTLEKEGEGNSPLPMSVPTSQLQAYRTSLQDSSTSVLARNGPTHLASLAPSVSQHSKGSVSVLSSAHEEDSPASLGATPTLTMVGALDLVRTSEAFIQHLNQSDNLGLPPLDSLMTRGSLGTLPSLQYLSLLVQNVENMVCLQRMQNVTQVSEESSSNGHGVATAQEMLVLSSTLGLPHFAASSVIQMSPSSVILVKPVFVVLPAVTPKSPTRPSPYAEEEREHGTSPSAPNKAGTSSGHLKQLGQTKLTMTTIRHPEHETISSSGAYLTSKQIVSKPAFNTLPKFAESSLLSSDSLTSKPLLYPVRELSTRTGYLQSKNHSAEFQLSTFDSQKVQENKPISLSVGTSASPPDIVSDPQRPHIFKVPTGRLRIPEKTTSLPPLVEPSAFQTLGSFLQAPKTTGNPQLSTSLALHTRNRSYGSMIPDPPTSKDFDESLRAPSAENMKLPLELGHFTFSRPTSYGNSSTELFGKALLKGHYVPITMSGSSSLPKGYQESASLSYSSESTIAFPVTSGMSTKTAFSKPSTVHVFSSKPPTANERPRAAPSNSILFSVDSPVRTTLSGKHLTDLMHHQVPPGLPAAAPSEMLTHSYFAKSAMEHNPTTRTLSGKASVLGTADQPEKPTSARETNQSGLPKSNAIPMKRNLSIPAVSGTKSGLRSASLVANGLRSMTTSPGIVLRSAALQHSFHRTPPHTTYSVSSTSVLKDTPPSHASGEASVLEKSHHIFSTSVQLNTGGTSKPAFSSPPASQHQLLEHRGIDITETDDQFLVPSSSLPQPTRIEDDHLGSSSSLDDERTHNSASTLPTPSMFSTLLKAPTLIMAISSSGVTTHGLVARDLNQASHLLDVSKRLHSFQTQIGPTLRSLSDTSSMRADGDFSEDATSMGGGMHELHLHTVGEQVAITSTSTGRGEGEAEDDPAADLPPWDSDWRAQHHRRRMMRSDEVFLNGVAIVSDDLCQSGNYTTEMSLRPAAEGQPPSSPATFLARIALKDDQSHASLSVKSCCVSPTAKPVRPDGAACCLFPRSLVECRHIQVYQNSRSQVANFTIQLFQMLDHSVVYLHCELGICLSQWAGCEQSCVETQESPSRPSERSSFETLHNVISLGPVMKPRAEFPPGPVAGSPVAVLLLGLVASSTVSVATILALWCRWRRQVNMAKGVERRGSETP